VEFLRGDVDHCVTCPPKISAAVNLTAYAITPFFFLSLCYPFYNSGKDKGVRRVRKVRSYHATNIDDVRDFKDHTIYPHTNIPPHPTTPPHHHTHHTTTHTTPPHTPHHHTTTHTTPPHTPHHHTTWDIDISTFQVRLSTKLFA
jgi:hypothetical protein